MATHTPGPWRVEEEPYRHIRSAAGCVWANDYKPDANARLIAAAPDMYAALAMAVAEMEAVRPNVGARQSARLGSTCDHLRRIMSDATPTPSNGEAE